MSLRKEQLVGLSDKKIQDTINEQEHYTANAKLRVNDQMNMGNLMDADSIEDNLATIRAMSDNIQLLKQEQSDRYGRDGAHKNIDWTAKSREDLIHQRAIQEGFQAQYERLVQEQMALGHKMKREEVDKHLDSLTIISEIITAVDTELNSRVGIETVA